MTGNVTFEFVAQIVGALILAVGVVVFVMREFGRRDIELEKYKTHVAENYSSKASVADAMRHVNDTLEKISTRLDRFLDRQER